MHKGDALPLCGPDKKVKDALIIMSEKGFGCVGVIDETNTLIGIVTDGDIRRHLGRQIETQSVSDIMTSSPRVTSPDALARDTAIDMSSQSPKVMQVFVLEAEKPVGIIHMHDFMRAGFI